MPKPSTQRSGGEANAATERRRRGAGALGAGALGAGAEEKLELTRRDAEQRRGEAGAEEKLELL